MRRIFLLLALFACRPQQRVENPYAHHARPAGGEAEHELDEAPGGVVQAADGSNVDLGTLWVSQRAVVVFYMGHWCPHCQKQLGDLNAASKQFADRGVKLIAISSDQVADAAALKDKMSLAFDVYADPQLSVISKWGVEDDKTQIARPATFVVEPGGTISFRKIGESPTVDQIVAALDAQKPAAP